jgi:CRP-like cAMP-binding protein/cytochrome P450
MASHQNGSHDQGKKLPPTVPGDFFFGNALQLKNRPNDFLVDAAAKYGSVFRLLAPGVRATVVAGPEGRELINEEGTNGLHRRRIFDAFASEAGVDIFGAQGELHERRRALIKLGYSRQIPAQFTARMVRTIREAIKDWQPGHELRLFDATGDLTMWCVMESVTPVSLRHLSRDIVRFGNDVMFVVTRGRPGAILWSPAYRRARQRVFNALDAIIARHRGGEFESHPQMYMIDALIGARNQQGDVMSDQDVRGACAYGLCGTQIYLGRVAGFMLYELLRDRTLMERVRREVDAAFTGGDINPKLFRRMPYLRAAYFETLRTYPLLPGLPFQADRDIEVNGYTIPRGDLVLITPVPGHFSSETYANPCSFDAARCMPPRNEHLSRGAFAPFGMGKRVCLAAGMCEVVSLTTVSVLLRELELKLDRPTYRMHVAPIPLIGPADGVPVVVVAKRKPPAEISLAVLAESSDLARAVEEEQGEQALPEVEPVTFEPGQVVIEQGAKPDYFYILLEGRVSVLKTDEATPEGKLVIELGPGQSFGELGLLKNAPRQATVRADTRVRVLRLDQATFMQLAVDGDLLGEELGAVMQQRYMRSVLARAMPRLDAAALQRYSTDYTLRSYNDGDAIIRQDDPAEEFFVLAAGKAAVERTTSENQVQQLRVLTPGSFFGEIGILNRRPRTATVRAVGAVEVMCMGRERFLEICRESSATHEDVAVTVCRRIFGDILREGPRQ